MDKLTGTLQGIGTIEGGISVSGQELVGAMSMQVVPYGGPYEFTPTQETQTVAISGRIAAQDITINPIPSNYGLIGWNGSYLTVS